MWIKKKKGDIWRCCVDFNYSYSIISAKVDHFSEPGAYITHNATQPEPVNTPQCIKSISLLLLLFKFLVTLKISSSEPRSCTF